MDQLHGSWQQYMFNLVLKFYYRIIVRYFNKQYQFNCLLCHMDYKINFD